MKAIMTGIFALGLFTACAHETTAAKDPQMEKMAQMHSDMADCLRSNKTMEECHHQMMDHCKKQGMASCPMMKEMQAGNMGMMDQAKPNKTRPTASKDDEHAAHHPENNK